MGATLVERIHTSSDSVTYADRDDSAAPSSGRTDSRWIQAPIAKAGFASIVPKMEIVGLYAKRTPVADSGTVQSEIAKLQYAAAASFFAFEDSLPDNEEG